MRRALALNPEILGGLDQTCAKELLPKPVHRYPRRQWMRRIQQPLRESQPVRGCTRRQWRQNRRHPGLDLLTRLVVFAARQHECLPHLAAFLGD